MASAPGLTLSPPIVLLFHGYHLLIPNLWVAFTVFGLLYIFTSPTQPIFCIKCTAFEQSELLSGKFLANKNYSSIINKFPNLSSLTCKILFLIHIVLMLGSHLPNSELGVQVAFSFIYAVCSIWFLHNCGKGR